MRTVATTSFTGIDERVRLQHGLTNARTTSNFRITADGTLEKRPDRTFLHTFGSRIEGIWKGNVSGKVTILNNGKKVRLYYRCWRRQDKEPDKDKPTRSRDKQH